MKKLTLTSLVIISVLAAGSGCAPSFINKGLVAYYPFNGNANDASGNNHNGAVVGAVPTTDRFGRLNAAYDFNGINSFISFSSPPVAQTDNVTLSAWINPASLDQYAIAVCLGFDNGYTGNGYALGMMASAIGISPGNHVAGILGGVTGVDSGTAYPSANVWCQVVLLRRAGVNYFYLNGQQTPTTSTRVPLAPTAFSIGSETGIRFFHGMIDDVRIYDRALSADEVLQLYQYETQHK